jgi:hypothetical protein
VNLEDIDKLQTFRTEWKMRVAQHKSVVGTIPNPVNFNGQTINDPDILNAIRQCVAPLIQKKLDEAKTRLMMLGVDEFPE